MATHTLKIGSTATIKGSDKKVTITNIEHGTYYVGKNKFTSSQLIAEKTIPEKKQRQKINTQSEVEKSLKQIYAILRIKYLQHNKLCLAKFPGCAHRATQVHHRYKRTGYYRIMTKLFFPICGPCHRYEISHPQQAYDAGISIERNKNTVPYSFTDEEFRLMEKFHLKPPI